MAFTALLRALDDGTLLHTDYDVWGDYAGRVDRLIGSEWERREAFWASIARAVEKAEVRSSQQTHKGLIYFKLGAMSLVVGRPYKTAIHWLRRAYAEDERRFSLSAHDGRDYPVPDHQSARRLLSIVEAFRRFSDEVPGRPRDIIRRSRGRVGFFLVALYDHALREPAFDRTLSPAPFDRLLGTTAYRGIVEENYRAAAWLCEHATEINRKNHEKYGLAQATLVLCGSAIEGILLANAGVRERYRRTNNPRWKKGATKRPRWQYELGKLVPAYLDRQRDLPEAAAGLVFIWFARNLVHPDKSRKHRSIPIEMAFANFAWSVTSQVIAQMARRARPRR